LYWLWLREVASGLGRHTHTFVIIGMWGLCSKKFDEERYFT